MKRTIIKIDEDLCNGCGLCVPNCHEGALQVIDGKVRLISDLFCDGLGACIGHCPEGAITLEEREAEPYDEVKVMELMVPKGRNTILAHLDHLREHNETELLKQAIDYIKNNKIDMSPKDSDHKAAGNSSELLRQVASTMTSDCGGGCPGSKAMSFKIDMEKVQKVNDLNTTDDFKSITEIDAPSELRQWPVQLHLLNPMAGYFKNADVVLAADCVAFAMGNFHTKFLRGKTLAIACPKLDSKKDSYIRKLTDMIDNSLVNTLNVVIMEVPCCSGLVQIAMIARQEAKRNIPVKKTVISIQGEVLSESWL
ncbi:MAG TPA: 4Fe-4S binding protein [Lentimicrobium sp.]|nr:4Fe-4S binding protein [Lentimicrobium sp.]